MKINLNKIPSQNLNPYLSVKIFSEVYEGHNATGKYICLSLLMDCLTTLTFKLRLHNLHLTLVKTSKYLEIVLCIFESQNVLSDNKEEILYVRQIKYQMK